MEDMLKTAAIATSDLKEPVRLTERKGYFALCSNKGINSTNSLTEKSAEHINKFFEEVMHFIDDKVMQSEHDEEEDVSLEEIQSLPPWFSQPKFHEYIYVIEDLTLYLDPDRASKLLDPITEILGNKNDHVAFKITSLRDILNTKCTQGTACIYRSFSQMYRLQGQLFYLN